MTDKQFDILMIYYGVLGEGLDKTTAMTLLISMGEHIDDISWLVKHLKSSAKARAHVEETA